MKEYNRTAYGRFMYNITFKFSSFVMSHMWLYYLLNYTWGLLTTLVGWIIYGFTILFLKKKVIEVNKFGPCHYIMIGNNWGGLELGTNFFVAGNMGESWTIHTKGHEAGHTFQNALFGPLSIFLIFIPSVIRYWLDRAGKLKSEYDAVWFEGEASDFGEYYYEEKIK